MKNIVVSKDIQPNQLQDLKKILSNEYPAVDFWEYEGSFLTIPGAHPFNMKYAQRYHEADMFFGSEKDCNESSIKGIKSEFKALEHIVFIVPERFTPPEDLPTEGIIITSKYQFIEIKKKTDNVSRETSKPEYERPAVHSEIEEDEVEEESTEPALVQPTIEHLQETVEAIEKKQDDKESASIGEKEHTVADLRDIRKEYEQKVIEYREFVNIPIWKKDRIKQKSIGVWSPMQRSGVSTFINNFAFFLAQYPIEIAVLEAISNKVKMKSLLSRYQALPAQWESYCSFISGAVQASQVRLNFNSVDFYPLDNANLNRKWDNTLIHYYFEGLKFYDVLMVDLPTGEMTPFTEEAVFHLDEVWILINNDVLELMEWKSYMKRILDGKKVKLIFNNFIACSEPNAIAEALEYPLITAVPTLHEEAIKNQYLKGPLYHQDGVAEKLQNSFSEILEYLAGNLSLNKKEPDVTKGRFGPQLFPKLWKKPERI